MSIWLEILGIALLIIGTIFCVLPAIPGQAVLFGAMALKYFCEPDRSGAFPAIMVALLLALVAVTVLDYAAPVWLVKKSGGSKHGLRGALIGTLAGLLLTPVGMLLGMFLGAFIGEWIGNRQEAGHALSISAMVFLGFLLSTGLKLIYASVCAWFFFTL